MVAEKPMAKVWVAYASENQQFHIGLQFSDGMTIADAIAQSKLAEHVQLPENFSFGIFGVKSNNMSQLLQAGDRVEIYRFLTINPKEIRRKRALENPTSRYCRGNRYRQILSK